MNYNKRYYLDNKNHYKKGGKYYKYKPKEYTNKLKINRGLFIIIFD